MEDFESKNSDKALDSGSENALGPAYVEAQGVGTCSNFCDHNIQVCVTSTLKVEVRNCQLRKIALFSSGYFSGKKLLRFMEKQTSPVKIKVAVEIRSCTIVALVFGSGFSP